MTRASTVQSVLCARGPERPHIYGGDWPSSAQHVRLCVCDQSGPLKQWSRVNQRAAQAGTAGVHEAPRGQHAWVQQGKRREALICHIWFRSGGDAEARRSHGLLQPLTDT